MTDAAANEKGPSLQKAALLALRQASARIEALEGARSEPLAIIGVACRFPGEASTPEAYWELLRAGTDAITEVPADRWDIDGLYDPDPESPGKMTTRAGGFIRSVDQFDPQFFGISPREAARMDPQQRLVLEVGWEAVERAGLPADQLAGTRTGVFLGASTCDYSLLSLTSPDALNDTDLYHVTGSANNIIAGRLSYTLGLCGPSLVVDTACSSALVAVHLAAQSLRAGESDLALAGGVSLMLAPELSIMFSKAHMLAPDGRCKTFDSAADGFARGEGCGIVVLRRLSDALVKGDPVLALVRGSAVNQDGRSSGLTAPNGRAQQGVIRAALANAHVTPARIGYVEAHGTGTALGDPIEIQAMAAVLSEGREPNDQLLVGAVKTNIGHLEAAAGIAGLIKAVLVLQHGEVPPNLHLQHPNPHIPWDELPVTLPDRITPWDSDAPRLAGVSSFGFSGTNAHVILEEAAQPPMGERLQRPLQLLCLSARSDTALSQLAGSYRRQLAGTPSEGLADFAHTANTGRVHLSCRAALIAATADEMQDRLTALAEPPSGGERCHRAVAGRIQGTVDRDNPQVAFLFSGQGAQYPGMGRRLYETLPVFRAALNDCDDILAGHLERPLLSVLYPEPEHEAVLDDTTYTQPALFALEYALAMAWCSWGIMPSAVLGHSVGEYVAACIAGVFSLEDGLTLVARRARLMGDLPREGAMAAVNAPETAVATAIAIHRGSVAIAAVNGPESIVISGTRAAVEEVTAIMRAGGTRVEPLTVSHAFHSPLMDPVLDALERLGDDVAFAEPQIDLISNLTGQRVPRGTTLDGRYLRSHARQPVRFREGINTLHNLGYKSFIEIGPKPVLLPLGQRCLPGDGSSWLPSLHKNRDNWQSMLETLGALYVGGAAVAWESFDRDFGSRRVVLPTYPFQRRSYWAAPRMSASRPASKEARGSDLPGNQDGSEAADRQNGGDWLYRTEWRQRPSVDPERPTREMARHWTILTDGGGVGRKLAQLLRTHNACVDLIPAEAWAHSSSDEPLMLPPGCRVIHLWGLDATTSASDATTTSLRRDQARHGASLLRVVKALASTQSDRPPRLWIVTRGAQSVRRNGDSVAVSQAPLWGFGNVIALEHPEFWGGLIDLDPRLSADAADAGDAEREAEHLFEEIRISDTYALGRTDQPAVAAVRDEDLREGHVAWRDGERHVARIVRAPKASAPPVLVRPDATYVITGGLGGLGGAVAAWLEQQGARHIALIGRSTGIDAGHQPIEGSQEARAHVAVIRADVTQADQLGQALKQVEATMPPVRGILHVAGVLDDGLLIHQDWTRFERVMAPKIQGAWNLHALTQKLELEFFALFSSAASLFGSPGQGNYAAANAFLDGLAYHRREQGLPAVSINWGPWDKVGMAATADKATGRQWRDRGISLLPPLQATAAMASLLNGPEPQVAVLRIDWARFVDATGPAFRALLAEQLEEVQVQAPSAPVGAQGPPSQPFHLAQLLNLRPDQRPDFLRNTLQAFAADALGMTTEDVSIRRDLPELGMDSLMVIEVTRAIQLGFGLLIYPKEMYENPTIDRLATYLDTELKAQTTRTAGQSAPPAPSRQAAAVACAVEPSLRPYGPIPGQRLTTPARTPTSPEVVFLLSAPRSGSTLLRVMLAGHPQLFCPPELHLLAFGTLADQRKALDRSYLHEGLQRALMELQGYDAATSRTVVDEWVADGLSINEVYGRLRALAAPRTLVDKSPTYAGSMETLRRSQQLFGNAKYVRLVRHPYAMIESFTRTRMHKLMDNDADPSSIAEQVWVRTNENMRDFFRQIDPDKQHTIRYEDLVRRPGACLDRLCAFLAIPSDEALLRPYDGARMTDGVVGQSRSIGDPNFLNHHGIEADLGDVWKHIVLPHPLEPAARCLAATFGYTVREAPALEEGASHVDRVHRGDASTDQVQCGSAGATCRTSFEVRNLTVTARGLKLCVNAWGPENGPTIVLLHGILDHGMAWEDVAAPLAARGYQVVAPDQRGHGRSAHAAAGAYQSLDYVADLEALVTQLALPETVMLVGHSMGAAIAAIFASLRPARVSGLVLVEGVTPADSSEDQFADLFEARLQSLAEPPTHAVLANTTVAAERLRRAMPSLKADRAQRMAERLTRPCDDGVCWTWDPALLTRADLTYDALSVTAARYRSLLRRITAPATLVYGRPDHPQLAELQAALPQAATAVVAGGHNLHIDAPAALARTIARGSTRAGHALL